MMSNIAIFFDRDDTLVYDESYMSRPEQIRLLPSTYEAISLANANASLYLLTNQSGIGRGFYKLEDAILCNQRVEHLCGFEEGKLFKRVGIAPEHPDEPSLYRKPSPRFILECIELDKLDKQFCFMIGDRRSDIECGVNAGVTPILVKNGSTDEFNEKALTYAKEHNIMLCNNVLESVQYCLSQQN